MLISRSCNTIFQPELRRPGQLHWARGLVSEPGDHPVLVQETAGRYCSTSQYRLLPNLLTKKSLHSLRFLVLRFRLVRLKAIKGRSRFKQVKDANEAMRGQ
jgi:hypothetical protein